MVEVLHVVVLLIGNYLNSLSNKQLFFYLQSDLNKTVGYKDGLALTLQTCLEDGNLMTPADYFDLQLSMDFLVGKHIKIIKLYKHYE